MEFIRIPKAIFTNTQLSVPAMVLYGYLNTEANNGSVTTSTNAMRYVLNCSRNTLTKAINDLIDAGLINLKGYTTDKQPVYSVEAL